MKQFFIILAIFFWIKNFGQAGSLDGSFGVNGKNSSCNSGHIIPFSTAIQSNGKIVSYGFQNGNTTHSNFLVRYDSNGNLDPTFGNNGFVGDAQFMQVLPNEAYLSVNMVVLPDDKILILLRGSTNYLIRLTPDGLIDATFHGTGVLNFGIGSGQDFDNGLVVQFQPDGKILVGGTSEAPVGMYYTLVRFNSNGTFDTTFGNNGITHTPIFNGQSGLRSIVVLPDGKIITGGYCNDGATTRYVLVQYLANGALDASFGTNGITAVPALQTFRWDELRKILVRPDGRIVVGGLTNSLGQPNAIRGIGLTQYLADGTLDTSFGNNGVQIIPDTDLGDMQLQVDGKIVMATPDLGFGVVRTLPNGTFDAGFGNAGYVNEFTDAPGRIARGVVIQPDNKIIVTGQVYTGPDQNGYDMACFGAMRLNPGVVLDVNSFIFSDDIVVYPNPSDGIIHIKAQNFTNEVFKTEIYNVVGQKVLEFGESLLVDKELNLSDLHSGTYFIKFTNSNRTLKKTILIK